MNHYTPHNSDNSVYGQNPPSAGPRPEMPPSPPRSRPALGVTAISLAVDAMLKIGGDLHVVCQLDIEKPETINALNKFGQALLDAYELGFKAAQGGQG